jgi:hypothetical protein
MAEESVDRSGESERVALREGRRKLREELAELRRRLELHAEWLAAANVRAADVLVRSRQVLARSHAISRPGADRSRS